MPLLCNSAANSERRVATSLMASLACHAMSLSCITKLIDTGSPVELMMRVFTC
jgi:hypothetical protein